MKEHSLLDTDINEIYLSSIVKAELRKSFDTRVAKIILGITAVLTLFMGVVSILIFENGASWQDPLNTMLNPAATFSGVMFILLICEEWTRGTALITYTFVPKRNKVILAKFIVLLIVFSGIMIMLSIFSVVTSIIASVIHSYSITWSTPIYHAILLGIPLFINMLFAFSIAMLIQESTIAIALYFVIPPLTVIATQLPTIGSHLKWFSLEHSSSLFIAGATGVSNMQYISSILIWIVAPCIIGVFRNMKRDLS